MYSHFNFQNIRRIMFVLTCLFTVTMAVEAQFTQSTAVMPPYSNKLSDYIASPGKINSIITVSSGYDRAEYRIYVHGTLMSTDESIIIRTKNDYKPATPIFIKGMSSPTGAVIFAPYTLTYSDILQIFNPQFLEYKGITRDQAVQQGLPENSYQICFSIYDYDTGRPLSGASACSNVFNVSSVEAPMIISPVNQALLSEPETKNIVFTWTRPPGSPVTTQYKLKIIELNSPNDNYQDKLNSVGYPTFFETTVMSNTYLYSIANPQLNQGKTYAFMVTAVDPSNQTSFKNKGKSEPSIFSCKMEEKKSSAASTGSDFAFMIPRKLPQNKPDTLAVSNNQDLLVNWGWIKKVTPDSVILTDAESIQSLGIDKYILNITEKKKSNNAANQPFHFSQTFTKDINGNISNKLQVSEQDANNAGFKDGDIYFATIKQYGQNGNLIGTVNSSDFVYKRITDEQNQDVSVQVVLKYSFKGFPEIYPVSNADVIAEALIPALAASTEDFSPTITIGNKSYKKIASMAFTTDDFGKITGKLPVPIKYLKDKTIYCRLIIGNQYYVDDDFEPQVVVADKNGGTPFVDFGQLTAKTYAYKLNLNVKKRFTSYYITQDGKKVTVEHKEKSEAQKEFEKIKSEDFANTLNDENQAGYYATNFSSVAPGIPVILYRIDKNKYIPKYEGDIDLKTPVSGGEITVVAKGITAVEGGKSYAVFERLLASNTDKYKILAVKDIDQWINKQNQSVSQITKAIKPQTSQSPQTYQFKPNTAITPTEKIMLEAVVADIITSGGSSVNFIDGNEFIAEPMEFGLNLPENDDPDAYYRTVSADYDIVSCKPPTSVIRGRLLYTWKSDKGKVKRPLANTRFRVVVNYVDDKNVSIGSTKQNYINLPGMPGGSESYTFIPDKSGNPEDLVPLFDQYMTMASGITNSNGDFEVEAVNMNFKGDLGAGTVQHSKTSHSAPIVTPGAGLKEQLREKIGGGLAGMDQVVTNPWNDGSGGNNTEAVGSQSAINSGFSVTFDNSLNSFELNSKNLKNTKGGAGANTKMLFAPAENYAHGPNPSESSPLGSDPKSEYENKHYSNFKRVFRIVIDGDAGSYYYPSADIITVQPLEEIKNPLNITHFVREFEMKVFTNELNADNEKQALTAMQVTLFRDLADKKKNLPQGEGDGKYTFAELINPQYNSQDAVSSTGKINPTTVFDKKFEHLWSSVPTGYNAKDKTSFVTLRGLVQSQYPYYFIEASSFVDKSDKTYQATIQETPQVPQTVENDWTNPDIPVVNADMVLNPLISRALITVRDVKSGAVITKQQNAKVLLSKEEHISGSNNFKSVPVDDYGKAEILANGGSSLDQYIADGASPTKIYFFASANGYKDSPNGEQKSFKKQGVQFTKDISLSPSHTVSGTVVCSDEKKQTTTVVSYIRIGNGKFYETDPGGHFEFQGAFMAKDTLKIIPKDVAYFDTTYVFTASDEAKEWVGLQDIPVFRRRHRIQFLITEKNNQPGPSKSISGATIQMGDMTKTTDANGVAQFNFENVSVNNYTFVIRGADGSNYIPKTVNVKNKETAHYVAEKVELEKGSEISGIVRLDGTPVKNAKVYLDVSNTSSQGYVVHNYLKTSTEQNTNSSAAITQDANLLIATTNQDGKYILRGVPVDNQDVAVRATLDTTFTVAGDKQTAAIKLGKAVLDLNLKSYSQAIINKIYGFPLTVEEINPVNSKQVKVTGLVHWTEAISDFSLKEVNKVLRVEDILFDMVNKEGSTVGIAHDDEVAIRGVSTLKLSYLDKYNVAIQSAGAQNNFNTQPLLLKREKDFGKISGKIKIVDNSFNYPSSYLNFDKSEFYLAKNQNNSINNVVDLVSSALSETEASKSAYFNTGIYRKKIETQSSIYRSNPKPLYYLCDKEANPIAFKLIDFPATANPLKSYIDETGKINLNVDLTCNIANAKPENFKVNIPKIVLDENKINPSSGTEPIKLILEKWTLEVKDWSFSTSEGGIVSEKAMIRTKVVDIPVNQFVLRNDMFIIDKFGMDKLALAGGVFPLKDVNPAKAHLNFEQKIGSDMKPHWNFNLVSNGTDKVASLPGLQGLTHSDLKTPYSVDFDYLQILSNDEMVVQLKQKDVDARLNGNSLATFLPQTIYNGPDYMNLSGTLNVGAPRVSDILLSVIWKSPVKTPAFENVDVDFETKGFVHFYSQKKEIMIDQNQISIKGKVVEKPEKTFNPIPSTFVARAAGTPKYEVMMQKGWVTQLTSEENESIATPQKTATGYSLKIDEGGMTVSGNDWTTTKFSGDLTNNETSKSDDIAPTKTSFEILGDISANSEKLSMSNINTPFGSMTQVFDFKRKELIGSLSFNYELTLGSLVIHEGTIASCFGAEGFYIIGACNAFIPAGIFSGNYNTGLMVGSHQLNDEMWRLTNDYIDPLVQNWCYKKTTERLSGFYFAFNRELFKAQEGFDFILAKGYVDALGLIGGNTYVNVTGGEWKVGLGGYVHLHAKAALSSVTGTSISGYALGDGKIEFQVGTPTFIDATVTLGFGASISQWTPFGTVSASKEVNAMAKGGTSGFSFLLESGGIKLDSCK